MRANLRTDGILVAYVELTTWMCFYRAMRTWVQSAVLRSHVVRASVCLSVCLKVGGSGPHSLEILETNYYTDT